MEKIPAFVGEDPGRPLQDIVRVLNDGFDKEHRLHAAAHANLIQLAQMWQQALSAPLNRFEREHQAPVPTLNKMKLPPGCPDLLEMQKRCQVFLAPSGTGAYYTVQYIGEKGKPWTAWDIAAQCFIRLITDPKRDSFGGPCPRCKRYFVRKTAKQSIYCSRRCASQETAIKATIRFRKEKHEDKLARAERAKLEWEKLSKKGRTKKGWKEWVATSDPEITKRFLTRAVNKSELRSPAIEEREKN
jgi:hypothetical protein